MKCPKCKAELSDDRATFCTYCGAMFQRKLSVREPAEKDHASENHSSLAADGKSGDCLKDRPSGGCTAVTEKDASATKKTENEAAGKSIPENGAGEAVIKTDTAEREVMICAISKLQKMFTVTTLLLAGLVVPPFNILFLAALTVLSFRNIQLTYEVEKIFADQKQDEYRELTANTREKCRILRFFLFYSILILLILAADFRFDISDGSTGILLGLLYLPYFPVAFYCMFLITKCFLNLFIIKKALLRLVAGEKPEVSEENAGATAAGTVFAVSTFAIPAGCMMISVVLFSADTPSNEALEEYKGICRTAESIKRQVELCIADVGKNNIRKYCRLGYKSSSENPEKKWDLSLFEKNESVEHINVSDGTIEITAVNQRDLKGASLILEPEIKPDGRIEWHTSPKSTCLKYGLCENAGDAVK